MPPVSSVLGNCVVGRGGIKASPSALVRGAQDATGWLGKYTIKLRYDIAKSQHVI
jgi:hypothetical protein